MKLVFKSSNKNAKRVSDSRGNQVIPCIIENDGDVIVLIVDKMEGAFYINKLRHKAGLYGVDPYTSDNFVKIESDLEYAKYYKEFQDTGIFDHPL